MFNKFTEELNIISELPDKPLEGAGKITVAELKAKFDLAGQKLKTFINSLIEALAAGTAAANIGAQVTNGGQTTNTTVQAALTTLFDKSSEAVSTEYTAALAADGWAGEAAPYTQAVTISGVLANDSPIIDLVPSSVYATAVAEDAAWGNIYRAVATADTITFYAKEAPTVALAFKARCIRK
jgi:hypothetical protein